MVDRPRMGEKDYRRRNTMDVLEVVHHGGWYGDMVLGD